VSPVKYELGLYIPEDDILRSHSHENLRCVMSSDLSVKICKTNRTYAYEVYTSIRRDANFPLCNEFNGMYSFDH
jgi:hypothetical protein